MRVLALDYGSARCGCAVSDPTGVLATPLAPVLAPASRRGLKRLRTLVDELDAARVVVGLPLALSGADTAQTTEARAFASRLEAEVAVPVELYDERFTTRLAQRTGGDASEDSRAAAHLLDSWLAASGGGAEVGRGARASSGGAEVGRGATASSGGAEVEGG
jgi:putative holliday junction resolvase